MAYNIFLRKLFIVFFLLFFSLNIFSANRYWVAGAGSNWNNTANWSLTSGGAGGVSVPGPADVAIFNANGLGNCNIDIPVSIGGLTVNGYTSIIDLSGFAFTTAGTVTLTTGTINDTPGTSAFTVSSIGITRFTGTTFGAIVNASSGRIYLNGSTFNAISTFNKTGAGSDWGAGGNTFNGLASITNSGTGYLLLGGSNADVFNADLTVTNSGTSLIYLAHNSPANQFNGNVILNSTLGTGIRFCQGGSANATLANTKTLTIGGSGFSIGSLRIRNLNQVGGAAQNIALTGSSSLYLEQSSTWNGNVIFSAPRIFVRQNTFNGTASLTKSGASGDGSYGGNVFNSTATIINNGSSHIYFAQTGPDTFNGDLTLIVGGTGRIYMAHTALGNVFNGNIFLNYVTNQNIHIGANSGTSTLANTKTISVTGFGVSGCGGLYLEEFTQIGATAQGIALAGNGTAILSFGPNTTFNADLFTSSPGVEIRQSVFNGLFNLDKTGTAGNTSYGGNTYNGITTITNSGSNYLRLAGTLGNTYNAQTTFTSSGSNRLEPSRVGNSNFNENLILNSSGTSTGILFGNGNGASTLAATKTVTIGGGGFSTGELIFRNFTQVGNTAQALTLTGTGYLHNYDANWGGDVTFIAPRNVTRGTLYNRTAYIEKTGATSDQSAGGNTFTMNADFVNSGSGYLMMGNGTLDTYSANVSLTNTGTSHIYFAYNGPGHTVAGELTGTNSPTGGDGRIYIGVGTLSTLSVGGNVTLTQNGSATNQHTYLGNQGDITINGTLTMTNSGTGTTSDMRIAESTNSSIVIAGATTLTNDNTATTSNRFYLGNQGDVTVNGTLDLINNSGAPNSAIYCNHGVNSSNLYNENITVQSTNANCDGVLFGLANGNGTLAATKTITIGGGGFIAGQLYFRNFTQVGPTNHTLLATSSAEIQNYDSDWGGNVDFRAPRMYTRGTLYRQTAVLEKTGALSDASVGGNTFTGNAQLINTGSGYFLMGNGNPDSCLANLDMLNSGTHYMYFAHNSAGNYIAGNLSITNTGSGTNAGIYVSNTAATTLDVLGNTMVNSSPTSTSSTVTIGGNGVFTTNGNFTGTSSGSGTNHNFYLGSRAIVNIGGTCDITNSSSATNANMYIAYNTASSIIVRNQTNVTNSGIGTTSRIYFGNQGDVTLNGVLNVLNSSPAANSQVYFNHNINSTGIYMDNIIGESTHANSDGVLFGNANGNGTLAATKTVTIGGGGFIAGEFYFRNFTQIGPTNQTLLATGTAEIENYDSDWGGNIDFRAPRMYTRGTLYRQNAVLEKTGALSDASAGGNTFTGNAQLINTGSGYFLMGNGNPDSCLANLDMLNSGTHYMYFAYNSTNNFINGDFTVNNTASGVGTTNIDISSASVSSLTINGITNLTNSTTSNNGNIILGSQGDVTLNNSLTAINNATGNSSGLNIANSTNSNVIINGVSNITNSSTGTTTGRIYLGNQGDITFNNPLNILNSCTATNSQIYCNYGTNSTGIYNDNIIIENTTPASDGILFGSGNGNGTLAATKTITIGGGGFIAGQLQFRNFTQLSATPQALHPTGSTLFYNYDSQWNGNVDFRSPRHLTRGTTYNGTAFLEKNGVNNDASVGGNVFNGDATFQNTSTAYFMPANGTSNDFNANATYIKANNGLMYPGYNCINTYAGDITINSATTIRFGAAGNGRTLFDGNTPQNINVSPGTPTPEFRDFQTNNLTNDITLNTPAIVLVELDLDNGHINTDATNLLIMNDNSTVSSSGELAFVSGPMRKIGNDAFDFPVGKNDTAYAPISISAPANGGHHFTAEYFQINPDSVLPTPYSRSLKDPTLDHVSACEYWILDRTNGASNINVTLSWDDRSCGVSTLSDLRVARWNGSLWKDHGNGSTTGNNSNGTVVTSAAVTSFSPFTLASVSNENPLPVELISFNAKLKNQVVDLTWQTASEINNDYFTIEKSKDGINWLAFAEQPGAGNSNSTINYVDFDYTPYQGISYYRLKQTDFNGAFEYSKIVSVDNNGSDILVYPNPVKDYLSIDGLTENHTIKVYATDGKLIFKGNTNILNTQNWSRGLYEVLIFSPNNQIQKEFKIVK